MPRLLLKLTLIITVLLTATNLAAVPLAAPNRRTPLYVASPKGTKISRSLVGMASFRV